MAPEAPGLRLQSPSSSRPQTWKRRRNVQKTLSRRLQALHKGRSETRPLQRVPSATDNAKTGRAVQPVSRGPPERTKERPFSRDYHQLAGSQSNTAELERGVWYIGLCGAPRSVYIALRGAPSIRRSSGRAWPGEWLGVVWLLLSCVARRLKTEIQLMPVVPSLQNG